jgi:hypothetical protein
MTMFNEAYAAVPLGEDIIKEYVMYTYDVPVSAFSLEKLKKASWLFKLFTH